MLKRIGDLIYPGGIFLKRIGHLLVFSVIGVNLFLNHIEDKIFEGTKHFSHTSIDETQDKLAAIYNTTDGVKLADTLLFGQPIKDAMNHAEKAYQQLESIQEHMDLSFSVIAFFNWLRDIYWLLLIYPAVWLFCDWQHQKSRKFLLNSFIGLLVFNVVSLVTLYLSEDSLIGWLVARTQ